MDITYTVEFFGTKGWEIGMEGDFTMDHPDHLPETVEAYVSKCRFEGISVRLTTEKKVWDELEETEDEIRTWTFDRNRLDN